MPLPFALDHINLWLARSPTAAGPPSTAATHDTTRGLWEGHFRDARTRTVAHVVATHYHPDHRHAAWLRNASTRRSA
jgi:glyoxylase-like metal-dependent hydrolase (beta-lactamase superfamily II)